jgi:formyl-CoA transferase/CoA:oxalate CoA-transferase
MEQKALSGILVIDLTQALAGPYCTQILADFGARVIKIERPGSGDQSRGWGPPFIEGESSYFMGTNRNKESLTLDLASPEAQDVLQPLLARADVVIHNVPRISSQKKIGIDAARVRDINPRVIWAAISGFGFSGPEAEKPGYDVIAQGMSGTMMLTGEPESGPMRFPTPMADITTGMYAAMGILTALYEREHSGEGQDLDVALLDSQATWLSNVASAFLATGTAPPKRGNVHPNIAPYQPFEAQDGWFILAAGTDVHWNKVIDVLSAVNPTLAQQLRENESFLTNRNRVAHREEMEAVMHRIFATHPVTYWIAAFQDAGVPCGPILDAAQALDHQQLAARNMIVSAEHPRAGTVRSLGNPIKLQRTPPGIFKAAPLLGEDTGAILREIGLPEDKIQELIDRKIV